MRWITRERPKIDRVACPWLITRFIDRDAEFVFEKASNVLEAARRIDAIPFDVDGAVLSHRDDRCSFDALIEDYALEDEFLSDLALIVRGADTDRLDLAPQCAGLLSISLGLSRLCMDDDHRMLAHGFVVYDALYEWLRHGRDEVHGWNPGCAGRTGEPAWNRLRDGALEIEISSRRVKVKGRLIDLRPKEFTLLLTLVARGGRVLSRGFLQQHVWSYDPSVTSRTLDWHVAVLRRRLGVLRSRLVTLRGVGYRWDPERIA